MASCFKYLFILGILLNGCCRTGDKCETPPPAPDGAVALDVEYPDSADPCDHACVKLRALGCREGNPTPAGVTCENFCRALQASGPIKLNPQCIVNKVHSCAEIKICASN